MHTDEDKRDEMKDEQNGDSSKRQLRREIFPFLILGAAVCAILNVRVGFLDGNAFGAALTGVVFGYIVWGFWRFFRRKK